VRQQGISLADFYFRMQRGITLQDFFLARKALAPPPAPEYLGDWAKIFLSGILSKSF
jgi:hypothetical protein